MSGQSVRGFVAVLLPDDVRARLAAAAAELRARAPGLAWVRAENLHVTLRFLGEVEPVTLERVREAMAVAAASVPPFTVAFGGLGGFPPRRAPRVVWAGATGDLGKLAGLAAAIERAAEQIGVPRELRPFVAHVTLGRIRSLGNLKRFQALLDPQRQVPLGEDRVERFVLYRSTLTSDGPVYEERAAFPLCPSGI